MWEVGLAGASLDREFSPQKTRETMKRRGWTMTNLARAIGIGTRSLDGWLRGEHLPPKYKSDRLRQIVTSRSSYHRCLGYARLGIYSRGDGPHDQCQRCHGTRYIPKTFVKHRKARRRLQCNLNCSILGCREKCRCRNLCSTHYHQQYHESRKSLEQSEQAERFVQIGSE